MEKKIKDRKFQLLTRSPTETDFLISLYFDRELATKPFQLHEIMTEKIRSLNRSLINDKKFQSLIATNFFRSLN